MERATARFTPSYSRFSIGPTRRTFISQYNKLYEHRLGHLRPKLIEIARSKWPDASVCHKIVNLNPGTKGIAVGTLFKDMKARVSVLKRISSRIPPPQPPNFTTEDDELSLEDESGRVMLKVEKSCIEAVATGVICAVLGDVGEDGSLSVLDMCFPGIPPPPKPPVSAPDAKDPPKFILLASGLRVADGKNMLCHHQLLEFVAGVAPCPVDQRQIVRMIIAGDSVGGPKDIGVFSGASSSVKNAHPLEGAMADVDSMTSQLSCHMPLDLMPGGNDPTSNTIPQIPMHLSLFPKSAKCKAFQSVPNPYDASIDHVRVLGTSGQPITDLQRCTRGRVERIEEGGMDAEGEATAVSGGGGDKARLFPMSALELCRLCLEWRHLAPTAPDTLNCYPFELNDPMVIEECPHIFFAGNQKNYAAKLEEGPDGQKVLLLSIPVFSVTGVVVLVNLSSLEAQPVVFSLPGMDHHPQEEGVVVDYSALAMEEDLPEEAEEDMGDDGD